jgi:methyltransferase (TIGR00027 family)
MDTGPSRTALLVAVGRGIHRLYDAEPWVLDDPFALSLAGPDWPEVEQLMRAVVPDDVLTAAGASLLVRARFTEDRLLAGNFTQYVLLGAGLDSFAWRRPDVLRTTVVFEVDHPASQAYKRNRAAELALPENANHRFVGVDFERATLVEALDAAGFDWTAPTLFSWLGVTMYLTTDAIETTLQTVGKCGAGSEVVFSYGLPEGHRDALGQTFAEVFGAIAASSGEPFASFFTRSEAEDIAVRCGLRVAEHPTHPELRARYFADRADGLAPLSLECLLVVAV